MPLSLSKFLEERHKKAEADKARQKTLKAMQKEQYEAGYEKGLAQAAMQKGIAEGRRKGMQPTGMQRITQGLSSFSSTANRLEREWFPEFSSGGLESLLDVPKHRTRHRKKR